MWFTYEDALNLLDSNIISQMTAKMVMAKQVIFAL